VFICNSLTRPHRSSSLFSLHFSLNSLHKLYSVCDNMFKICILLAVGVDQLVQVASIDQTVPGRELADSVEPHILQPQIIQTEYVEMNGPAVCPQGERSMNKQCDAKRPWPQCPPQSYCYATGAVDLGPYWCCGAGWSKKEFPQIICVFSCSRLIRRWLPTTGAVLLNRPVQSPSGQHSHGAHHAGNQSPQ
jgi:hypothetical protein